MEEDLFPSYGLLGLRQGTYSNRGYRPATAPNEDNLVYANIDAPWSAFICGSQGAGKSHTLSCLLENSLLSSSPTGKLPNPLAGLVFHYDKYTSTTTTQLCEAAYLCSSGVPVQVLVSPSNYHSMARLYSDLPGLPPHVQRPKVMPLYLQERQLNISNMKTLMAVCGGSNATPLYLDVLFQILRDMALERQGRPGVDYLEFKDRLRNAAFSRDQKAPLNLRLQLLESFLEHRTTTNAIVASSSNIWDFKPGSLTIVDLSDPFVNDNDACALFSICLTLFMENRGQAGRIVALDEAHKVGSVSQISLFGYANPIKFLTRSGEALSFTEDLVSIIRQQRHLATRILIATQEPTLSPALIDLCNATIVHRFLSPAWYETLKQHLAGARPNGGPFLGSVIDIFQTILGLETGEALLFSPTSLLDVGAPDATNPLAKASLEKLEGSYIKLRIRNRVSADGGKSIMASDAMRNPFRELGPEIENRNDGLLDPFDAGLDFIPLSSSRFGPAASPRPQPQRQPNALIQRHEPPAYQVKQKHQPSHIRPQRRPIQTATTKEENVSGQARTTAYPQTSPAHIQPATQQKISQQSSKNGSKAPQLSIRPAQSQTSQVPQESSKDQKKAAREQKKAAINQR